MFRRAVVAVRCCAHCTLGHSPKDAARERERRELMDAAALRAKASRYRPVRGSFVAHLNTIRRVAMSGSGCVEYGHRVGRDYIITPYNMTFAYV